MYVALYFGGPSQKEISLHEDFDAAVEYLAAKLVDENGALHVDDGGATLYDVCERRARDLGYEFYIAIDVQTPETPDSFTDLDSDTDEGEW